MNIVTLAIPGFFLLMALEALVGRARGRKVFRGPDVFADLFLGAAQTLFGLVFAGALIAGYQALYARRAFEISTSSALAWVGLMVGVDFFYYWFHRVSHRMALAWAAHAPHHQSEDFNLAVALRQGPFQPAVSRVFYLPLAFLGFPPAMTAAAIGINTVYQFWIHTELIGKLGPLEWVLNTPSHHRAHHGCEPKYIDRNHGGILIIWDRLFGTFVEEREPPTYGTVTPVASFNPLVATVVPFGEIAERARKAPRWIDKWLVWIMPPEWKPRGFDAPHAPVLPGRPKYDVKPPRRVGVYVTAMSAATLLVTILFLFRGPSLSAAAQAAFVGWFVASVGGLGGLLEAKRWAKPVEIARVLAAPVVLALLF
ncbi:sterol desaturase family protein [Polyangium aurulentum]|uniref:sterol desaturase family protein n=1 Tax=Polyangium aurulentum TaxID=2567896 RepID=UPI0010AE5DB7|nr:sterol desaturase family protein [Polyangium aurulentum]UQA55289.1 sterol desaturase family protein [Polyangium aurulentum]